MTSLERLQKLNARVTEFAYGDNFVAQQRKYGLDDMTIGSRLMDRHVKAGQLRAGREHLRSIIPALTPYTAQRLGNDPKKRNEIVRRLVRGVPSHASAKPFSDAVDKLFRK